MTSAGSNNWPKILANAVLFQLCWVACVIGGDIWALMGLILLAVVHVGWVVERSDLQQEFHLILPVISLGIGFDTLLFHLGWLSFPQHTSFIIPFWLMALWLAFAATLRHSLAGLLKRYWFAALFGAAGAPWSYFLGSRLGAVEATPAAFIAISLFWAALLVWVSVQLRQPKLYQKNQQGQKPDATMEQRHDVV